MKKPCLFFSIASQQGWRLIGGKGSYDRDAFAEILVQNFTMQFCQVARESIQFGVIQHHANLAHFDKWPQFCRIDGEFRRAAIGAGKAAGAEVDTAVVAHYGYAGIDQIMPFQVLHDGFSRSAGGLAGIMKALQNAFFATDFIGEGEVMRVGVLGGEAAQHEHHRAFVGAVFGGGDEAGFVDGLVGLAGLEYALQMKNRLKVASAAG